LHIYFLPQKVLRIIISYWLSPKQSPCLRFSLSAPLSFWALLLLSWRWRRHIGQKPQYLSSHLSSSLNEHSRRFGGKYRQNHKGENIRRARNNVSRNCLLVTANVSTSSLILFTLTMGAIGSFNISIPTITTLHIIPEDCILHRYPRESLKTYLALTVWAV
jgi:hypothetical protein